MALNLLISLILTPFAAYFFSDVWIANLKYWVFYKIWKKETPYEPKRWKPLDCSSCMSVHFTWISLLFLYFGISPLYILFPLASGGIASLLNKL
jgi:hypothetical protein